MIEYEQLVHMEKTELSNDGFYMPHHAVFKKDNDKIRVVFDDSRESETGLSLNDTLKTGPTCQNDIYNIHLSFRKYKIALIADIDKIYRQIIVYPEDQNFQKIIWRDSPTDELQAYKLKTVTYGTTSAPYLATRCLQEISSLIKTENPTIAEAIYNNFSIDDLVTSTSNASDALKLKGDISNILLKYGFNLSRWSSNHNFNSEEINSTQETKVWDYIGIQKLKIFVSKSLQNQLTQSQNDTFYLKFQKYSIR